MNKTKHLDVLLPDYDCIATYSNTAKGLAKAIEHAKIVGGSVVTSDTKGEILFASSTKVTSYEISLIAEVKASSPEQALTNVLLDLISKEEFQAIVKNLYTDKTDLVETSTCLSLIESFDN